MVIGGVVFAALAVLCIVVGVAVVKKQKGFEPMSEAELEAEEEQ
jgi:hypothetical protein